MSFKKKYSAKQPPELVSLIDMIFILLVFFLVTSFAIKMPLQERSLLVPTPENKPGRAQIFIQFLDEDHLFWLDESANRDVETWDRELFYMLGDQKNREIIQRLIRKNQMPSGDFYGKLRLFVQHAKMQRNRTFFIVIRCPDHVPYVAVMKVLSILSQADNVEYGCLGGSIDDLLKSRISTGVYQGKTVLKIDF
ncbi:biopolymer transporter ExbD [bacterium]|nr:biopolymer transporter ExbD [bacterium]